MKNFEIVKSNNYTTFDDLRSSFTNRQVMLPFEEVKSRTQGLRPRPRTQKNSRPNTALRKQTLSRPRAGMLEAKAMDRGHRRTCSSKNRKVFKNYFQAISARGKQTRSSQILRNVSGVFQQNFNDLKSSAVPKPRSGKFLRT